MKIFVLALLYIYAFYQHIHAEDEIEDDGREAVTPDHLDKLLAAGNYEEFNRLLGIDIPELTRPVSGRAIDSDPRYNPLLEFGDIVLTARQKEHARQALNMEKWPTYEWPCPRRVPICISDDFSAEQKKLIMDCIASCNTQINGSVVFVSWTNEVDYIMIFAGNGCYSRLGRTGKQQVLSLQKDGCLYCRTICHELMHALGFMHEQCRIDRDDYIWVNYTNIPNDWWSQFDKVTSPDWINIGVYDFYSIMHYRQRHYQICKDQRYPAFVVKKTGINEAAIGNAEVLTNLDKAKIATIYRPCNNAASGK